MRLKWWGTPFCWKIESAHSRLIESFINQFCCIAGYAWLLTVLPSKKKGSYTRFSDIAQNAFTLGESRTCSSVKWACSVPYMRVLCLLTLPVRWKVASLLNTRRSSDPSCSDISRISVQKSLRAGLSVSFKCWRKCSLYTVFESRRFLTTRQ